MKFLEWTAAHYEKEGWPKCDGFIDPSEEWQKLWNLDKKLVISKDDISQYAANFGKTQEEAAKILREENNKKPFWTDEKKAEQLKSLYDEMEKTALDYCVDNHIFVSDYQHQSDSFKGVPVLEDNGNKYVLLMTFRAWGGFMADVWNKILKTDKFNYLSFYCNGCPKEVENFLRLEKENR